MQTLSPGIVVYLEFDPQPYDPAGDWLAYLFLPSGRMLNVELIRTGLARPRPDGGNLQYPDLFQEIAATQQPIPSRIGRRRSPEVAVASQTPSVTRANKRGPGGSPPWPSATTVVGSIRDDTAYGLLQVKWTVAVAWAPAESVTVTVSGSNIEPVGPAFRVAEYRPNEVIDEFPSARPAEKADENVYGGAPPDAVNWACIEQVPFTAVWTTVTSVGDRLRAPGFLTVTVAVPGVAPSTKAVTVALWLAEAC